MKLRSFPTAFHVMVTRCEKDRTGAGVSVGATSLPEAMVAAFKWAIYYAGARGASVVIVEHCSACKGDGISGRTRRLKPIVCKICRGSPEVSRLAFQALPPEDCKIIRHDEQIFPVAS